MTELERKYEIFGTRLATHLQRLYRGQCGRVAAELELWQRYQTCAFIIQRAYREHVEWHEIITHTVLRRLQQSSHLSENLKDNIKAVPDSPARQNPKAKGDLGITKPQKGVPMPTLQPTSVNFARCLRNKATFDEKMSVWRAIIELRRGHPAMSSHICLKAMLESNGDLSRAMVLMGDETYHLKNEGGVPLHLRSMFMPYLRDQDYLPKSGSPSGSPSQKKMTEEGFKDTAGRSNTGNSIGLDGIRKLKAAEATKGFVPAIDVDEEEDSGLDLTDVIAWTYFSKYFQGQLSGLTPPCQRPNTVQHIPPCKPISVAEIIETEERAAAAARPRAVSPIVTTGSPGFSRGRGTGTGHHHNRTFRGDSRSPSPTNKYGKTPAVIFGAPQSTGRPGKLKRKLRGLRTRNGGNGHYDPNMTSEEVHNRKNADAALLTSLMLMQDEMDRTQRVM